MFREQNKMSRNLMRLNGVFSNDIRLATGHSLFVRSKRSALEESGSERLVSVATFQILL